MTDLEQIFDSFKLEYERGSDPHPQDYLERLDVVDRAQLSELIEAYVEHAPGQPWHVERYSSSTAAHVASAIADAHPDAGLWPRLLPKARAQAQVPRQDLVKQLAESLGVSHKEEKVALRYDEMEQGLIPAAGVSDRLLDALGGIIGRSKETLRDWGSAQLQRTDTPAPAAGFAHREATAKADHAVPQKPGEDEDDWDEVDELFWSERPDRTGW